MKTLAEKIAVMQAFGRGEKIEVCVGRDWCAAGTPTWNWQVYDYRIAPKKPREFTVMLHGSSPVAISDSVGHHCILHPDVPIKETTTIRVREVVEDEPKIKYRFYGANEPVPEGAPSKNYPFLRQDRQGKLLGAHSLHGPWVPVA